MDKSCNLSLIDNDRMTYESDISSEDRRSERVRMTYEDNKDIIMKDMSDMIQQYLVFDKFEDGCEMMDSSQMSSNSGLTVHISRSDSLFSDPESNQQFVENNIIRKVRGHYSPGNHGNFGNPSNSVKSVNSTQVENYLSHPCSNQFRACSQPKNTLLMMPAKETNNLQGNDNKIKDTENDDKKDC